MRLPIFSRPRELNGGASPHLYVANCGPSVGLSFDTIASFFSSFGEVKGVYAADESGSRVIVSFAEESFAKLACEELNGHYCSSLGGRRLHICFSALNVLPEVNQSVPVCLLDSEVNIPGVYLLHDFITAKEEEELIAAVDGRPWKCLSKRRVQHYGFQFCYNTRNVNSKECLGKLPPFVSAILKKLPFPNTHDTEHAIIDQLTVNEYKPGVGLSPHIDTHSAFEDFIFSLSLAGSCVMEFRKYPTANSSIISDKNMDDFGCCCNVRKKAVYLPPRSMLLLSGEGRYAWHHYIPHHKVDLVNNNIMRRGPRRISLTLRKVRNGPCTCQFPDYCDSHR